MQGIRGPGPRDWTEAAGVEGVPQATERAAQSPGSPEREHRCSVSEVGPWHWGLKRKECARPGDDGEGVSDYPRSTKICAEGVGRRIARWGL